MVKLALLLATLAALAACHCAAAEPAPRHSSRTKRVASHRAKPAFLLDVSGASAMLAAVLDASPANDNDDDGDPWPRLPPRQPLPPHDPSDDPRDDNPVPPPTIPPPGRAPLPPPGKDRPPHRKPPHDKPAPMPGPPAGPPKHRNPGNEIPPDTGLPGSTPPPERDLRPVYNRLLHAETRALFIPPLILLALVGVHTVLMYAAATHRARRNAMLLRHGAAAAGGSLSRAEYGTTTHTTRAAVYPAAPGGATAPGTDPTSIAGDDLTRRDVAEHAVGELVREARGHRGAAGTSRPGTGDEAAPLLGGTDQQQRGVNVGLGESVLGGGGVGGMEDESDPITDLWDEFTADVDHATALDDDVLVTPTGEVVTSGLATRAILVQRDGITAVKNGGHVAMFAALLLLGMAVLASFGATMLPAPTHHDDAVGSRDRTLALVTAEWGILGAALVWAYAESTMLAVHDLNRARVGATLVMLVLALVYGVQLNSENLARLHGVVAGPDVGAGPAPVVPPLTPPPLRAW